jgi:hypothetical protein
MKKKIDLTPEWVLRKLPCAHYADGKGNGSVYTDDSTDANFIELALKTLRIFYKAYQLSDDKHGVTYAFEFKLEDIVGDCTMLFKEMSDLDYAKKSFKAQTGINYDRVN